ncbi:hypothetical protein AB0M20_03570 [Actinoplanes sp. NPDC051633]|uniref:hypothetical protein n=1 Tax=Actinoplanes sp. NPDC051633 TaxID=3155670 RepID=UPI0034492097
MESNYTIQRPLALPAAVCAPSAAAVILAAPQASLSRVHQVQTQAELARILVPGMGGSISGFGGGNDVSVRGTDVVGGAPPRGRPV